MEEVLLYFSLKYEGDFHQIMKALKNKEKVTDEQRKEAVNQCKSKYITLLSDEYPESLKQITCPPFVLYYHGDISLLNNKTIGVIGKRKASNYGIEMTRKFTRELVSHDFTIVSGMALGIDSVSHQEAIINGKTIAVLGSGINYCYPKSNKLLYDKLKKDHLVISEYPNDYAPKPYNFPIRNRLIAGLSKGLLVSEAEIHSGTMTTVQYALEQGKDVFCIPGRIGDPAGCNVMIQTGAKLVLSIEDILEEF